MIYLNDSNHILIGQWKDLSINLFSIDKLQFTLNNSIIVYEELKENEVYTITSKLGVLKGCTITEHTKFQNVKGYADYWKDIKVPTINVFTPGLTEFNNWWSSQCNNGDSELESSFKVAAYQVWKACWEVNQIKIDNLEEKIEELGYVCMGDDL